VARVHSPEMPCDSLSHCLTQLDIRTPAWKYTYIIGEISESQISEGNLCCLLAA
jgi:hypothetical protein